LKKGNTFEYIPTDDIQEKAETEILEEEAR